ncbi:MAG: arginine--tRNA ligase [Acutalibacteraceae bacterium]|jgi:arginyl-tRNA synthetase|nr:arginine--tRNA ligase [Clostridiales bacterium]
MSKLVSVAEQQLKTAISNSVLKAVSSNTLPNEKLCDFVIEVPADRANGDFSANVAMASARVFKLAPRKIADIICENICLDNTFFDKCEVAGPGFLNFFLNDEYYASILKDIRTLGDNYGRSDYGKGQSILVEFVSANPTGPMHMGNARGGALGDCLASVLDYAGYDVSREFYINDAGNQIDKFGLSLDVRYLQHFLGENAVELPEDSYHGEDITLLAKEFANIYGDKFVKADESERQKALIDFALPKNIENMQSTLQKYRIEYDKWFNESVLHNNGELEQTLQIMKERGLTYEKDGALWYKATEHGGEKDEVLVRANGNPTYFAADIAYHRNKLEIRGFDKSIDIWGADHHGHVARMKGALDAIGIDGNRLDVVLMQLVRLTRGGEVVRMSKRTGKAITLVDLLEEIPIDAARFLFNMREPGSQMEFDLDLAVEQSSKNPVYYCQYAHARICSIVKKLKSEGVEPRECSIDELKLLCTPEEKELIRHLSSLTNEIVLAAKNYDPARITRYVVELSTLFHKFYNACRVRVEDESLMQARLYLCICVRDTIKNILTMLRIDAPQSM